MKAPINQSGADDAAGEIEVELEVVRLVQVAQ